MKSKEDKLDVDKSVPAPVDLSKLSDAVKDDVVKKDVYNAKIKNIKDEISDITNLATNTTLNAKINEAKNEIPSSTNLATSAFLNAKINEVKGKTSSILVKKADYDAEIKDIKDQYFTTSNRNKFTNNILDEKITAKNLVNESVLNEKIKTLTKKRRNKKISNNGGMQSRAR